MSTSQKIKVKVIDSKPPRIDIKASPNLKEVELGYVEGFFGSQSNSAKIYYDTVEGWNSQTSLLAEERAIYVYTDYQEIEDEEGNITYRPGIKIGDGAAYVIDLPFLDQELVEHITDTDIHITALERLFWNNKLNVDDDDEVVDGTLTLNRN